MVTGWRKLKVRDIFQILFRNDFYFSFLGLMDFSDIVTLCNRPNSCCQQNQCFDMPLLSLGLFS